MYEPSGAILVIRDDIEAERLDPFDELQAQLILPNGAVYSTTGELIAPGYTVSVSTGTIDARFRFENPKNRLLPGMFVRGQVALGATDALLVPKTAAIRGRDGRLTAWVVEDGKAARRVLTEDGAFESNWIGTDGLEPGDMLIVDDTSGLAPEAEVGGQATRSGRSRGRRGTRRTSFLITACGLGPCRGRRTSSWSFPH